MSYHLVWLDDLRVLHVRDYPDGSIFLAHDVFEAYSMNSRVVAVELFVDAHDSLHARVLATRKWLDDGILNKGVPS